MDASRVRTMIGECLAGKLCGQFKVIREIGRGGFGIVYLADDRQGQPYAVKLIAPVSDPEVRLSFEQELKSTEGLRHENLLSIVDYGVCAVGTQQGLFAVTEYCPDGDYRRSIGSKRLRVVGGMDHEIHDNTTTLALEDLPRHYVFVAQLQLHPLTKVVESH
jgi:serine/threonine protein kinase